MPDVRALFSGASPAPEVPQFDPNQVSPGLVGFLATFAMVIVVVFLMRDFSRRVRRIQHRSEAAEREAQARRDDAAPSAAPDDQG